MEDYNFETLDETEIECPEHKSPIGGICSDLYCTDLPLLCIKCAIDPMSCMRLKNHQLITMSEFFKKFRFTIEKSKVKELKLSYNQYFNFIKNLKLDMLEEKIQYEKKEELDQIENVKTKLINLVKKSISLNVQQNENGYKEIQQFSDQLKEKVEKVKENFSSFLTNKNIEDRFQNCLKNYKDLGGLIFYLNDFLSSNLEKYQLVKEKDTKIESDSMFISQYFHILKYLCDGGDQELIYSFIFLKSVLGNSSKDIVDNVKNLEEKFKVKVEALVDEFTKTAPINSNIINSKILLQDTTNEKNSTISSQINNNLNHEFIKDVCNFTRKKTINLENFNTNFLSSIFLYKDQSHFVKIVYPTTQNVLKFFCIVSGICEMEYSFGSQHILQVVGSPSRSNNLLVLSFDINLFSWNVTNVVLSQIKSKVKEMKLSKNFLNEVTSLCFIEEKPQPNTNFSNSIADSKFSLLVSSSNVDKTTKFEMFDSSFNMTKTFTEVTKLNVKNSKSYFLESSSKSIVISATSMCIMCIDPKNGKVDYKLKGHDTLSNNFEDVELLFIKNDLKIIGLLGNEKLILVFSYTNALLEKELKYSESNYNINSLLSWNEKHMLYNVNHLFEVADLYGKEIYKPKYDTSTMIMKGVSKFYKFYVPDIGELLFITYKNGKIELWAQ